jgi:hypothetical protein
MATKKITINELRSIIRQIIKEERLLNEGLERIGGVIVKTFTNKEGVKTYYADGYDPNDKFYPKADNWMWNYCVFLGKFSDNGENFDLGIYVDKDGDISDATVYSNTPGDYSSGEISPNGDIWRENGELDIRKKEVIDRARKAGFNIRKVKIVDDSTYNNGKDRGEFY